MQIISGKDNLFAYRLNDTTEVTNIASSCCNTFLLGRHSGYDANCVTAQQEAAVYCNTTEGAIVPYARFFTNQWSKEKLSQYKPMIGIWVDESTGDIVGEDGYKELFQAHIESVQRGIPNDAVGITFDDILKDIVGLDNIIVIVSDKEQKNA